MRRAGWAAALVAAITVVGLNASTVGAATLHHPRAATATLNGYWMLGTNGAVYTFGNLQYFGGKSCASPNPIPIPGCPVHQLVALPNGTGYYIVNSIGMAEWFGSAGFLGSQPSRRYPTQFQGGASVHMAWDPEQYGAWFADANGVVVPLGGAVPINNPGAGVPFYGDLTNVHLSGSIIDIVATPSGHGYYMLGTDGGVFSFGDAHFYGSMGGKHLNQPIEGIVPTLTGRGYWLVASDGGVFAFGDARFRGSMGGVRLNRPIVGMIGYGDGYLMVASDGGIFDFSDKPFVGSLGGQKLSAPIVSVAAPTD